MPEMVVPITDQLILLDQSLEGLDNQFLALVDVLKHFAPKNKVASVNGEVRVSYIFYPLDTIFPSDRNHRETLRRLHTDKARHLSALLKEIDHFRKGQIGKNVRIVRQEIFFFLEKLLHPF